MEELPTKSSCAPSPHAAANSGYVCGGQKQPWDMTVLTRGVTELTSIRRPGVPRTGASYVGVFGTSRRGWRSRPQMRA